MKINLLIIIGLSSLLLFISCQGERPSGEKGKIGKPTQIVKFADILRSQNGKVEVQIKAPIVYNYDGDSARMAFPKGLKVWFYNKDLSLKSTLIAKYAITYNNSNKVFLKDSIEIVNYNNKDTIYCKELIWDKNLKTITSDKEVRRQSLSGIAYGDGFQSNEQMDSVRIKNLRGTQYVSEDE
ncbi:MAG: LPS export ABC transporter periplasmic protein LptC [Bacteroidales bacterium]|nr:LPS export ABC transporter periplasmic protein LptC [Bacteroidales bacterium]